MIDQIEESSPLFANTKPGKGINRTEGIRNRKQILQNIEKGHRPTTFPVMTSLFQVPAFTCEND